MTNTALNRKIFMKYKTITLTWAPIWSAFEYETMRLKFYGYGNKHLGMKGQAYGADRGKLYSADAGDGGVGVSETKQIIGVNNEYETMEHRTTRRVRVCIVRGRVDP